MWHFLSYFRVGYFVVGFFLGWRRRSDPKVGEIFADFLTVIPVFLTTRCRVFRTFPRAVFLQFLHQYEHVQHSSNKKNHLWYIGVKFISVYSMFWYMCKSVLQNWLKYFVHYHVDTSVVWFVLQYRTVVLQSVRLVYVVMTIVWSVNLSNLLNCNALWRVKFYLDT